MLTTSNDKFVLIQQFGKKYEPTDVKVYQIVSECLEIGLITINIQSELIKSFDTLKQCCTKSEYSNRTSGVYITEAQMSSVSRIFMRNRWQPIV